MQSVVRIGRFEVIRELGHGSSSAVLLARDTLDGRLVALKLLHAELVDVVGAHRFEREIRVLAALRHPNIVPVLEVGRYDDRPFFTMPFIDGCTLRQQLLTGVPLAVEETMRIAHSLCAALAFAHTRRVLHRDVKPENVLRTCTGIYLADFGLARALDEIPGMPVTSRGISLGTPAYMSPEQVSVETAVDARTDQYSLALVLYECLAGSPAFSGISAHATASLRLTSRPTPLVVIRPDLPHFVTTAIERALERDPDRRFRSITDFAAALGHGVQHAGHGNPRTLSIEQP